MLVIAVIFVYIIANLGVIVYFWRKRRDEFNWILHFVFPVGTSAVLIYSLDKSFNPLPAYPGNWAPWLVIAWFALGVVILGVLKVARWGGLAGEGRPDHVRAAGDRRGGGPPAGSAGSVMPAGYRAR